MTNRRKTKDNRSKGKTERNVSKNTSDIVRRKKKTASEEENYSGRMRISINYDVVYAREFLQKPSHTTAAKHAAEQHHILAAIVVVYYIYILFFSFFSIKNKNCTTTSQRLKKKPINLFLTHYLYLDAVFENVTA